MDSSKQNPIETGGHKLLPFTISISIFHSNIYPSKHLYSVWRYCRRWLVSQFFITITQLYFCCVTIKEVINVWSPINTGHMSETNASERFLHKRLGPFDLHLSLHLPVPFTGAALNYVLKWSYWSQYLAQLCQQSSVTKFCNRGHN